MAMKCALVVVLIAASLFAIATANKEWNSTTIAGNWNHTNNFWGFWPKPNVTAHRPKRIIVGGSENWHFGYNYTDWAIKNGPFYLNDILVFRYAPPSNTTFPPSNTTFPPPPSNTTFPPPPSNTTFPPPPSNTTFPPSNTTFPPPPSNTTFPPSNTTFPPPPSNTTFPPPPSNTTFPPSNTTFPPPPSNTTFPPSNTTFPPSNTTFPPPPSNTTFPQSNTIFPPPPSNTTFPHSVYLVPNFWSFQNCDLRWARKVGEVNQGGGQDFEFVLNRWQPYFFVCGERNGIHCRDGMMKFAVWPLIRWNY